MATFRIISSLLPRPAFGVLCEAAEFYLAAADRPRPKGTAYVAVRGARQVGPITAVSDLSNVAKVEVK